MRSANRQRPVYQAHRRPQPHSDQANAFRPSHQHRDQVQRHQQIDHVAGSGFLRAVDRLMKPSQTVLSKPASNARISPRPYVPARVQRAARVRISPDALCWISIKRHRLVVDAFAHRQGLSPGPARCLIGIVVG